MAPSISNPASTSTADPRGSIKVQYKVFVHTLPADKHILVLRFPNRDRSKPYNVANGLKPLELRIKPKCGLVELDVPLMLEMFDRRKGLEYGEALRASRVLRDGESYGIGGSGGGQWRGREARGRAEETEPDLEDLLKDFDGAVQQGRVMNRITLAGRVQKPKQGEPVYYLGVFKMDELHLTRVTGFCNLVPNFKHLDAVVDKERASHKAARDAENPPVETEARAINITVKSTDDEENDVSDISATLREMQEEKWQRLEYVDEETSGAWSTYNSDLFCPDEFQGHKLVSTLTNEQYLDLLSAPRVDPSQQGEKIMRPRTQSISEDSDSDGEDG